MQELVDNLVNNSIYFVFLVVFAFPWTILLSLFPSRKEIAIPSVKLFGLLITVFWTIYYALPIEQNLIGNIGGTHEGKIGKRILLRFNRKIKY